MIIGLNNKCDAFTCPILIAKYYLLIYSSKEYIEELEELVNI